MTGSRQKLLSLTRPKFKAGRPGGGDIPAGCGVVFCAGNGQNYHSAPAKAVEIYFQGRDKDKGEYNVRD
jgi:hypothetical protein